MLVNFIGSVYCDFIMIRIMGIKTCNDCIFYVVNESAGSVICLMPCLIICYRLRFYLLYFILFYLLFLFFIFYLFILD